MRAVIFASCLAALANAGCRHVECGPGTFKDGDTCVGFDPNDKTPPVTTISPAGGKSRDPLPAFATITSNEPAQIYVTTDGSTPDPASTPSQPDQATVVGIVQGTPVTFFGIDAAGNQEAPHTVTFVSDTTPPAQVPSLAVTITGTTAHVSWTNPSDADFAGTIVARVDDIIDTTPADGTTYTLADTLSPSLHILSAGSTDTSIDDPGRIAGPVRYVAWTYDDVANYSAPVAAVGTVDVGTLSAELAYNTATQTLSFPAMPPNLDLSGSTASLSGTTLTLTLSIANKTTLYFENPKAEVTAVANGSFANADGNADGHPFKSLGPNMLAAGATATATLTFSVTAGQTATIDVLLAQHPTVLSSANQTNQAGLIDFGTNQILPAVSTPTLGPEDRMGGRVRPPLLTGGHFMDIPTTHGVIERFDLVTGAHVGAANIDIGERCNVQFVVSNGADLIALVKFGGRRRSGAAALVRLDEGLHVQQQLVLPLEDDRGFGRPSVSADGATLAVPVAGTIVFVDLRSLTLIDLDRSTPAIDTLDPGLNATIRGAVFFGAGNLVALSRSGGLASILTLSDGSYTSKIFHDTDPNAKGFSIATGPDGRVWMAFSSGIRAYDPVSDTVSSVSYPFAPQGLAMVNGQMWILRSDRQTVDQVSASGAVQRTTTLPYTVFGHWFSAI